MWTSQHTLDRVTYIKSVIAEKIPDGIILPEHTADTHYYRHVPTGKINASVTTKTGILSNEHLKRWAAKLAVEYLEKNWDIINNLKQKDRKKHHTAAILAHEDNFKDAGNIGTQGHEVVERYLLKWMETGERPADITKFIIGEDSRLWAIARSAEQFFIDYEVIPIAAELKVVSIKYGFAGTLDSLMMVKIKGRYKFCLVDFKTSNSIDNKPTYNMQVSAYWQGLNEMTRTNPTHATSGLKPQELLILQLDKYQKKYKVVKILNRSLSFRAFIQCTKLYDFITDFKQKTYPLNTKKETFLN